MPKIKAPTVREHREQVRTQLVDAAEHLLRTHQPLTAQAVSERAGIARNSIYRYVDSVSDLYGLVLARKIGPWQEAVSAATAATADPRERIVQWAVANLEQAARTGHGWMVAMATRQPLSDQAQGQVHAAHGEGSATLRALLTDVDVPDPELMARFLRSVLDSALTAVDSGMPLDRVRDALAETVRRVVA